MSLYVLRHVLLVASRATVKFTSLAFICIAYLAGALPLFSYLSALVYFQLPPPMDRVPTSPPKDVRRGRPPGRYWGVRRREWGKWVSEIRVPRTGKRIWLGSYDAPEKAARAYDAARYCIHGECGPFNFPTERRPTLPEGFMHLFSETEVKAIASDFALAHEAVSESDPIPASDNLNVPSATGSADKIDHSASLTGSDYGFIENLELDDFLMFDLEWLSDLS